MTPARRCARLVAAAGLVLAFASSACSGGDGDPSVGDPAAASATDTEVTVPAATPRPLLVVPELTGELALGPLVTAPAQVPTQAGADLQGRALPTNQWWTSALIGPGTGQLWAMPIVAQVVPGRGIDLRVPAVVASPNAVISAIDVPLTLVGAISGTQVLDHDDFSVLLELTTGAGDRWTTRVAQGTPSLTVTVSGGPVVIDTNRPDTVFEIVDDTTLSVVDVHGRRWSVFVDGVGPWRVAGSTATADPLPGQGATVTFVPEPDGADPAWEGHAAALAADPVVATSSTFAVDWAEGDVHQTLTWRRAGDSGTIAVAPHQWTVMDPDTPVLGTYPTPRGPLRLVAGTDLDLAYPVTGFVPGVPDAGLGDPELAGVLGPIDTADAGPLGAGSYFGSKHLARLATLVELARRVGSPRADLEDQLRLGVVDSLTNSGEGDTRWMSYDPSWGGVILHPAEFGSQDYNDHHFHYGYLLQAAAVLAEIDPTFADEFSPLVDLLIDDIIGGRGSASFPERRVFNPYLGHSFASGFSPFADGNNQESSSEAINAWWAVARWSVATGDQDLIDLAIAHLTVESRATRVYWLGELGDPRPEGYAHEVAGIVWGGKIDFATWFDPRPSAVIGIQLLPVNFGSLHRADPDAAQRRYDASASDLLWPDVSLMDLAVAAPAEALAGLTDQVAIDDGNTLAFARYWAASLAALGPPRDDITIDAPYGAAFGPDDRIVLVGVNPTASPVEVGFRRDGEELGRLVIEPHSSARLAL